MLLEGHAFNGSGDPQAHGGWLRPEYERILRRMRTADVIYTMGTGLKVGGGLNPFAPSAAGSPGYGGPGLRRHPRVALLDRWRNVSTSAFTPREGGFPPAKSKTFVRTNKRPQITVHNLS